VEEFLAKSGVEQCKSFRDTSEVVAKVAFRMFLGITAEVKNFDASAKSFSLIFKENPLDEFVELPPSMSNLKYSNLLCGVIRGALHMLHLVVECELVASELTGGSVTEIQVKLKEKLQEIYQDDED
jgi:trafficking protein particle complex subunit 3